MITKLVTVSKLKQLFLEVFINKTDKATDISDNSVVNATAFGVAKVAQKCIKDIAVLESTIMPDTATGGMLDYSAKLFGATPRKSQSGSSTYVRVSAAPGTIYTKGVNYFNNYNGIRFDIDKTTIIGDLGFDYIKVYSIDKGDKTNVDPNSIVIVSPQPNGHIGCTNEFKAIGGRDTEDDELFRQRIKKHRNIYSKGTLEYFANLFREINGDILKVLHLGLDDDGKRLLGVVTVNGATLSQTELDDLLDQTKKFFPLGDLDVFGDVIGVKVVNCNWFEVNIDFRVQVLDNFDVNEVRKNIQVNLSKYFDFRLWDGKNKIEWDDLLEIVKNTVGVKYVPDKFFTPSVDISVPIKQLPRIKSFKMRDLGGNIIMDSLGILTPIFYSNE